MTERALAIDIRSSVPERLSQLEPAAHLQRAWPGIRRGVSVPVHEQVTAIPIEELFLRAVGEPAARNAAEASDQVKAAKRWD